MSKERSLSKAIEPVSIPSDLERAVLLRVRARERGEAQIRLALVGGSSIISLVAVVPVLRYLAENLAQSGLSQFVGVALSDASVISGYWKELVFSVVESTPFLGVIVFLSILGVFLWSSVRAMREARVAFISSSFAI